MSNLQTATMTARATTNPRPVSLAQIAARIEGFGIWGLRYGLVTIIAWIGAMKFTAYEANAIQGLVASSPLMGWVYSVFSVEGFAVLLGSFEIGIAFLLALRPISSKAAAAGGILAAGMFLTTLSFMLSTPGVTEATLGGFPALSVVPGQFLVKDFALLGGSLILLGEALRSISRR